MRRGLRVTDMKQIPSVLTISAGHWISLRFDALKAAATLVLMIASLALVGCSTQRLAASLVADQLAAQSADQDDDLELTRDAAPFFLKFGEAVLAKVPDHAALAETLAAGFVRYAWAFVAFEADRIEGRDLAEATRLRKRAAQLYLRAERHAMRALEIHYPGIATRLAAAGSSTDPVVLDPKHAGLAYWGAAAWGARISLSKGEAEAVAQLPAATLLVATLTRCCLSWGDGAVASLAGSFEAGRPGGSAEQAMRWFDQAASLSNGKLAAVPLARAEALSLPTGDRATFERLAREAIAIALKHPGADNQIMLTRARWLLDTIDDRF